MSARSLLVVCPDYASHYYPLSAVAQACRHRGMTVTIATGPGLERAVRAAGFGYERLVLGPGQNTGVLRPEEQGAEAAHMRQFFDATRRGPIATLLYQGAARRHDMLHAPERVHKRLAGIIERLRPDLVLVDQLSYSATLALHALRIPFASFHPGHPAAIPGPGELFGLPAAFPPPFEIDAQDLENLRATCLATTEEFTAEFNRVLARLAPRAPSVPDAFAFTSPWLVLLNSPGAIAGRRPSSFNAHFLGSCVRAEAPDPEILSLLERLPAGRPLVYVTFGTFLSVRDDALGRVVAALRRLPVNVVLASGEARTDDWEPLPEGWIVRPVLPQIEVLRHASLAVTHGGNNSVTEALTFGVPLLVGPFSSDQFDNARDILAGGLGEVFDPNSVDPALLAAQVRRMLDGHDMCRRVHTLGQYLRAQPGPERAAGLLATLADSPAVPLPAGSPALTGI